LETKIKRTLSLLLSVLIVLTALNISAPVKAEAKSYPGYSKVAASETHTLYMNEENLSIIVEDKATGATMESAISYDDGKNNDTWLGAMKSAVVLTLLYKNVDTDQADLINDKVTKNIKYLDNGFSAEIFWTKYKLGLTLEVTLEGNELKVNIPDESIVEKGETYNIGTISVYPFLGNTYLDSKEGYMYIPDGNGALIYLDNKEGRFPSGYASMVYGQDIGFDESSVETLLWDRYSIINDAEKILSPTFGMAHTDEKIAYLGIIENGAERASVVASPNGACVDYNRIGAKFLERKLYTQPTSNNSTSGSFKLKEADRTHSDLTVRYIFLSGDDANYTGMATAYRNYLFDNGRLSAKDTSYKTRIDFLGTDREEWVVGTSAVTMTTVSDIRDIYSDLETAGVTDLFSLYKGWQKGGIYDLPATKFKTASSIGSAKELASLIKDSSDKGISLYLYTDALRINPDEKNATFNVVKKVNKKKYEEKTYKDVYENFQFLTPARSLELTDKLADSILKKGVSNIAVSGISNNMFSYSYNSVFYSRKDCGSTYEELVNNLDGKANLVLEQPFAYLWDKTEAFVDMPLYDSEYIFEDTFVPFLSIVLKGVVPVYSEYMNFEANKQEFLLKMIETGTYPSFYITKENSSELIYTNSSDIYSSEYSVYRDTIIEYTNELKYISELTEGAYIKSHEMLEGEVTKVTYDNGVTIYLNYSETSQTVDGNTLDSMTYKVIVNE